jgi:hypothetical protein
MLRAYPYTPLQQSSQEDLPMNDDSSGTLCSVNDCPRHATHREEGASRHWRMTIFYCAEHARELLEGTPLGYVGLDPARVHLRTIAEEAPLTGAFLPSLSPQ